MPSAVLRNTDIVNLADQQQNISSAAPKHTGSLPFSCFAGRRKYSSSRDDNMNNASLEQKNDDSFYAESCENILEKAHNGIRQAENLIESIKYSEDENDSVFEDIDKNIQRLERSQEQITGALRAFKHLKSIDVNLNENVSDQGRHHLPPGRYKHDELNQIGTETKPKFSLYDNQIDPHSTESSTNMIESVSDYHSDPEFSNLPPKRNGILGSFGKGGKEKGGKMNKSKSIDILDSEINNYLLNIHLLEEEKKTTQDSESFSNSFPSEEEYLRDPSDNNLKSSNDGAMNSVNTCNSKDEEEITYDAMSLQPAERKILYIAKEIMTSEKVYVDVLKLLNIDFRNFIQDTRRNSRSQIIPTEHFLKIFSNLPEIMMLNSELLRDFEERVQNWARIRKISDIIVKKGPYLKLYTTYVQNYSTMTTHLEDCCEKFPKFRKLVKEFEKFPQCRNLKLTHFLLKPIQRLPQYKLLLEDYLKHLDVESPDYDDTATALTIVTEAAEHANETIKQMVSADD